MVILKMEKKLNISERLMIMQILPKEGNFVLLKMIRDLNSKVGFSADEIQEFNIKTNDDKITWDSKGMVEKAIDFKIKELEIIADALKKLDKESKLEFRHFSIFEKFAIEEK